MILDNIKEKYLSNGLKVITLNKKGAPVVAVQIWYNVGSINEHEGIRGISHVLEHMMFRGSENVKSEEHARLVNETGGYCNAFTTEDTTVYINNVPKDFFEMVLKLESDRMDNLTLDNELFNIEKKVIIEEYHNYINNPLVKSFLEFRKEFFGNHPYAISPLGTLSDLENLTVDACRNYYQRWYKPSNAKVVIVGDVEADKALELTEKYFGEKRDNNKSYNSISLQSREKESNINKSKRIEKSLEFDVPILLMGFPAPSASNEDAVALEVLQVIMSGGESSRMHTELVRKKGVAVMAGGINQLLKEAGISMFFAAFTPDVSVKKVEEAINEVIAQIKNKGISLEEIDKVKNTLLTNRTFELYNSENICSRIGFSECIEGNYRLWVKRLETLEKISPEMLISVAKKYLNDSTKHILYLKPKRVNPVLFVIGFLSRIFKKR
ncbi:MAG: insulinase family protein [Chitinispirillaceae bacterium]|nr:insulinase family protein [Chitinispirillaceae bacterium]